MIWIRNTMTEMDVKWQVLTSSLQMARMWCLLYGSLLLVAISTSVIPETAPKLTLSVVYVVPIVGFVR